MGWTRSSRVIVAATALVTLLAGCGAEPAPGPPHPLRILLVNAEGWTAPGTMTLRAALRHAGHTVVQVTPLGDQTMSGTAITAPPAEVVTGPVTPTDPDMWATSGTATDATLIGLGSVMGNRPPDLVIVGISARANVGMDAMHSGAIGGALAAAQLGIPAVAVSTDLVDPVHPRPGAFDSSANFAVRLVDTLTRHPTGTPILPRQTVLNVNYPRTPSGRVVSTTTADTFASSITFRQGSRPGLLVAVRDPVEASARQDDVESLSAGDVTLSDLSADPDRTVPPPRVANRLAPLLSP